jgi:ATP-dependent Clp protease ATP-binding subunit ClpC
MFTDFSPPAQAAIDAAQTAARVLRHDELGLEHLLLGLLRTAPDLPLPEGAESGAGLSARLGSLLEPGHAAPARIKATPGAVAAIGRARTLMRERGDAEAGSLHLLVGVLDGLAGAPPIAALLGQAGIEPAAWRGRAAERLRQLPVAPPGPALGGAQPGQAADAGAGPTPNLDRYGRDLTALARSGALPPLVGRERELRAMIEVLCKITKNNPALVGEPGVGKTAIVEGLAQRMAADKVPFHLRGRRLVALDLNAMVAGARYRGDFEERLKALLDETEKSHAVLFLDEMHTMIGAGDGEGRGDVANVLKPYLSRGDISVIGATTTREYRRYIESDGALERRFQPLTVKEPTAAETLIILQRLRPRFEEHYRATISDAALEKVIDLGRQHLRHRHFPDKAIDVLQLACARALMDEAPADDATPASDGAEEARTAVSVEHVVEVVAELTGVPLEHFAGAGRLPARYLSMEETLEASVFGQPEAVAAVANALRVAKQQMGINPQRPDGVFLFLGPTGVGKGELSRALGRFLFGDEERVILLDMSEFSEPHTVARLIGSPPGYVGYDEGGQLTERIRSQPFSLLVLDELEKAHPSVINLFLQVFDEGRLTDTHGRTVYFSDVTVILTSNAGADRFAGRAIGFATGRPGADEARNARPISEATALTEARKHFPAELLSRVDKLILFHPLSRDAASRIVRHKLQTTLTRIFDGGGARPRVTYDEPVVEYLVARGFSAEWGGRHVERAIEDAVLAPLARRALAPEWAGAESVRLTVSGGAIQFETDPPALP